LKAKAITTHFKHSSQNTKKLLDMQKQLDIPEITLKQECPTRWNSRYEMLERLFAVKEAVSAIAAPINKTAKRNSH
jgi:viroplasmin and RNaseH domain-containing protein